MIIIGGAREGAVVLASSCEKQADSGRISERRVCHACPAIGGTARLGSGCPKWQVQSATLKSKLLNLHRLKDALGCSLVLPYEYPIKNSGSILPPDRWCGLILLYSWSSSSVTRIKEEVFGLA